MPTKTQINRTNAASFAQLLEEVLPSYPAIQDFYYCDHSGVWCITRKDGDFDEFGTFNEALIHLGIVVPEPKPIPFHILSTDFHNWAICFFAPGNGHTDRLLSKEYLMADFRANTKQPFTVQRFMILLRRWASKRTFTINPDTLLNNDGRIIRRIDGAAKEMVYVQRPWKLINE